MLVRCDKCGRQQEGLDYDMPDGWLSITRHWHMAPEQERHACSEECAAYLAHGPWPEPETFADE